jgi:Glycosyl hydrolase catalytic core
MVPATMSRTALVAVLCAVMTSLIAVFGFAQVARADEPIPLGQTAPAAEAAPSADTSAVDNESTDPAQDGWATWLDVASDGNWSWDDWFPEGASATPASPDATDSAPASAEDPAPTNPPSDGVSVSADASGIVSDAATTLLAIDTLAPPAITVTGTSLDWTATAGVGSYVFVRKVPGLAPQYSIVNGTSTTPPAVAGETVNYSVRTNVSGSTWAPEVSIAYPGTPDPTVDPRAALRLSVGGAADTTVVWNDVPGVSSYVFVRKIPNQAPQYSLVSERNWLTPPYVYGQTVRYGVRTNVSGSTWAPEVSITYPDPPTQTPTPTPTPTPAPTPSPTPPPVDGSFHMGVVSGSALMYELPFIKQLGAHTARLEFGIGSSASSMASTMEAYAQAGIHPLLLASFYGRTPSSSEAQNLASWAKAYGPGGTFWQGKSYPTTPGIAAIEFGNETSFTYQFSDNSSGAYAARAQTYAQRAKEAGAAIAAANPRAAFVVIGDNAQQGTSWVTNMFRAVPNLDDYVSGWTIHPYGPNWATRMDSTVNSARTAGSRDLPLWVTEWGLSSDNGRCLDDNYGFDTCMTYGEAATTLHSALAGMQNRYGSRLGALYLYQANDQYSPGVSTSRERYFGALQIYGAGKGAYTTEVKADLAVN